MPRPFDSDAARDAFLAEPRLAILMTNRDDNAPMGVPVWFEWTGSQVLMFAARGTPKLKRMEQHPDVSVLVTNHIGEAEAWVAFDGTIDVNDSGAAALIQRLGPKYWDMADSRLQDTINGWVAAEDQFVLLTLTPTRIRSGA